MDSRTSHLASVRLTRSNLSESEVATVGDFRATSKIRTVADLGRCRPVVDAVAILDMGLHARMVTTSQLREWIASHAGYRGIGTLRRAIELAEPAAESPMETRLRLLLMLAGLPKPRVQVSLRDGRGIVMARADLYYPGRRLVIEYDGGTQGDSLAADNRRQNRLIDAGCRILRFTAVDVLQTPATTVALVRRAIAGC